MPIGSSSGPAVAVAARVAPFALCEDTGGIHPILLYLAASVRLQSVCAATAYRVSCTHKASGSWNNLMLKLIVYMCCTAGHIML